MNRHALIRVLGRLLIGLGMVFVSAAIVSCSGPKSTAVLPGDTDTAVPTIPLADQETFDADPYRDTAPRSEIVVKHDVPEALMQNRADAGTIEVIDGYRVQVFSSLDRLEAVQMEEDIRTWWADLSPDRKTGIGIASDLPVYNTFRQPLYRVRAGDFTSRTEAERLMVLMASRFTTVFVVPDQVTVSR